MRLFVGPLPETVDQRDLGDFVGSGSRRKGPLGLFKKTARPVACTMMESHAGAHAAPIFFAVVHLYPDSLALKAIATLDGNALRGRMVRVRRFIERDTANDRRRNGSPSQSVDQRARERRGDAVLRIAGTGRRSSAGAARKVVVTAVKGFAREYWS
jgi:hypothetical protein